MLWRVVIMASVVFIQEKEGVEKRGKGEGKNGRGG